MSDDKLREAAELLCVSVSLASDGGVGQFLKALSGLRAALADSATADAPPEPTEEMVGAAVRAAEQYRDGARNVFVVHLHVLAFFHDVLRAALATQQKGDG